jgi:hypothetical protein
MWESITRETETKETIVMLHVGGNCEQDNRMIGNGDEDHSGKHWSMNRNRSGEKRGVSIGMNLGMLSEMESERALGRGS